MKRKIIVLTGLDGSGKSTQAELLCGRLNARGIRTETVWMRGESYLTRPVLRLGKALLRAPRETKRGEGIEAGEAYGRYVGTKQTMFRSGLLRAAWRWLAIVDLWISLRVALSRLHRETSTIVMDRYIYDTFIDIDSAFGAGGSEVERLLGSPVIRRFPQPLLVVLLDIPPGVAMKRKDDIPSLQYLEERHELYRRVAVLVGASVVDGTESIEQIQSRLVDLTGGITD
jgi:thymidylate kinase